VAPTLGWCLVLPNVWGFGYGYTVTSQFEIKLTRLNASITSVKLFRLLQIALCCIGLPQRFVRGGSTSIPFRNGRIEFQERVEFGYRFLMVTLLLIDLGSQLQSLGAARFVFYRQVYGQQGLIQLSQSDVIVDAIDKSADLHAAHILLFSHFVQ